MYTFSTKIQVYLINCFEAIRGYLRPFEAVRGQNLILCLIRLKTLEPRGLTRRDGKKPDGMTQFAWKRRKNLLWDVTVADTVCTSYVIKNSRNPGAGAAILEGNMLHMLTCWMTIALCLMELNLSAHGVEKDTN